MAAKRKHLFKPKKESILSEIFLLSSNDALKAEKSQIKRKIFLHFAKNWQETKKNLIIYQNKMKTNKTFFFNRTKMKKAAFEEDKKLE